jgi:hypothetical protein
MTEQALHEVTQYQGGAVVNFEEYAMTTAGVLKQVAVIQEVMKGVMHIDEHFGTIPGTNKPSLYKPGAEKLSLVFRLRPEYEIRRSDLGNGHREYEVVCTLYHIPTGQSVGQGVGSATTMEGKYRYRPGPVEFTGKPVPKAYWDDPERDLKHLGGKGFTAKKNPDTEKWEIAIKGASVEHDNPADYYNTILKMAKKRAHVDAILTATAASDIFTQDVEDMPEVIPGAKKAEEKPPTKPPLQEPGKKKPEEKKADSSGNILSVTGKVGGVEAKPGTNPKTSKPYTLYTITVEGEKYLSFDDTHADLARSAEQVGTPVTITFTVDKWGNKATSLTVAEGREAGQEG